MNKEFILHNILEAKEQIDEMLSELKNNTEYDLGEYVVDMQHLYHHLNTAWNAKHSTTEQSNNCIEENFYKWRTFPKDIEMK